LSAAEGLAREGGPPNALPPRAAMPPYEGDLSVAGGKAGVCLHLNVPVLYLCA
jgi:hypothetical protein